MTDEVSPAPALGLRLEVFLLASLSGVLVLLALHLIGTALATVVAGGAPGLERHLGWTGYYASHLWVTVWLVACLVYGTPQLASRARWLRKGRRFARGQLTEYGSGIYGAVGLATFVVLEYRRILEQWWPDDGMSWRWFVGNLLDFGLDTFLNGIWAAIWPAMHGKAFSEYGGRFWPALGVAAAIYYAGRAVMAALPRDEPMPLPPVPKRV